MDAIRIAELLQPFLAPSTAAENLSFRPGFSPEEPAVLSPAQLESISIYIDLLLRWNSRINLTSVRDPEHIVTRHFGESLLAARILFPGRMGADFGKGTTSGSRACPEQSRRVPPSPPPDPTRVGASPRGEKTNDQRPTAKSAHLIDLGSGAGFPGLPIKIWDPSLRLALIESNQKKVAFLREVARSLALTDVNVFAGRAEDFPNHNDQQPNTTVTLRAVENFASILRVAASLVPPSGRLALLIGESQVDLARQLVSSLIWSEPVQIPLSTTRVLMIGTNHGRHESDT